MSSVPKIILIFLTVLTSLAQAAYSPCPFNYPNTLNSTESRTGLTFTVISNNPLTNNRAVQLRPGITILGGASVSVQLAVIDPWSPALLGQLRDGALYSEGRNDVNQLSDLGPTALLGSPEQVIGGTDWLQAFEFADPARADLDTTFQLQSPGQDGSYGLYHNLGLVNLVNGFVLCENGDGTDAGRWFQLYYRTYTGNPADRNGCESVGVRTTAAATIYNGVCDIGGYYGQV